MIFTLSKMMMMGYFTKVTAAVPSGRVRAVEPPAFYGTKFGDKYKEERAFKGMPQKSMSCLSLSLSPNRGLS